MPPTNSHELKLSKAKIALIRDNPFFASILLRREIIWTDQISTGCITPKAQIMLNPQFVDKLDHGQLIWLLCHEVLHVAGGHFMRQGARNLGKWNWATDAWINKTLNDSHIGNNIPNTVQWTGGNAAEKTSEELYNYAPEDCASQMAADGIGIDLPQDGGIDAESSAGKAMTQQIKIEVGQAANVARAAGKLPGQLQEFCDRILAEHIDWFSTLSQFMTQLCKSPMQSWSRANKRFRHVAYLPSAQKEPQLDFVVVQLDTSGSITPELMAKYISHIEHIIDQCQPQRTLIMWCDTRVQRTQELIYPEPTVIDNYTTYGGTDMEAGFRYLEEHEPNKPDAMIVITDGETHFSEKGPDYPVIWAIDNKWRKVETPYGINITINTDK